MRPGLLPIRTKSWAGRLMARKTFTDMPRPIAREAMRPSASRNAICAVSQDRCTAFCSSDMLGNLGATTKGQNRWDIFAYGLCGQ
jgi:hypothetical protein